MFFYIFRFSIKNFFFTFASRIIQHPEIFCAVAREYYLDVNHYLSTYVRMYGTVPYPQDNGTKTYNSFTSSKQHYNAIKIILSAINCNPGAFFSSSLCKYNIEFLNTSTRKYVTKDGHNQILFLISPYPTCMIVLLSTSWEEITVIVMKKSICYIGENNKKNDFLVK